MKLLVIDDDPLVARQLAVLARRSPHQAVVSATSCGDIADEDLAGFDIIILDLLMPDRDGIEWMRRLHELGISARLILLSGLAPHVVDLAKHTAITYGHRVIGSMRKPVQPEELGYLMAIAEEMLPKSRRSPTTAELAAIASSSATAIADGRFALRFQPQLGLASENWFGVRLTAILEESVAVVDTDADTLLARVDALQASVPFTLQLLERGLDALEQLRHQADFRGLLTLDVLPSAIAQPTFTAHVLELLARHALPPGRLNLHIDGAEPHYARAVVQDAQTRLAMHGVIVSSAHLGAGTGQLFVLDSSMTRHLRHEDAARRQARAQIQLCHDVGMAVLALGVDDLWTAHALADAGCDVGQGDWAGAAMTMDTLISWARRRTGKQTGVPGY